MNSIKCAAHRPNGPSEIKVERSSSQPYPQPLLGNNSQLLGLFLLSTAEMFERFSFYSMLSLFTLYLMDTGHGFGWTMTQAVSLYSWYLLCVYISPLIGGALADWKLGYRTAAMIGGLFFMVGYLLLGIRSIVVLYIALVYIVIGNGFFKPNISVMVGDLYPEGSRLKDRAYIIFYAAINIGAFAAPAGMDFVKREFGYIPCFVLAAFAMLISVLILWLFHLYKKKREAAVSAEPTESRMAVSPATRVAALALIFGIIVLFWIVFHQNGIALTRWGDENTARTISNTVLYAINPILIIFLAMPLVVFWWWLDSIGKEPSTITKISIGMALVGISFFILFFAAKIGVASAPTDNPYAFKVSPLWLMAAYLAVSLGELMISPMGLTLVSKVAPLRLRGLMMGGWFLATTIGNRLSTISINQDAWSYSTLFAFFGGAGLFIAVVLLILSKPLKKWVPMV